MSRDKLISSKKKQHQYNKEGFQFIVSLQMNVKISRFEKYMCGGKISSSTVE